MYDKSASTNNRIIKFWLKGYSGDDKYKRFDMESTYLDSDEDEQFHGFGLELIRRLSERHVVNYSAGYRLLKPMKRKFYSRIWSPAVFDKSAGIEELHKELIEKEYPNSWYGIKAVDYGGELYGPAYKGLYLVQNQLDMDLFLKFMITDAYESRSYHEQIGIYPEHEVDGSYFNTFHEIIDYYCEAEYMFLIVTHTPEPLIHIDMNINYFTAEQLIRIIKSIAEKHSFTLEIEDMGR